MKRLYSPKVVKEIIDLYDFNFKKSLGQNFLIDKNFVDKIVDAAAVSYTHLTLPTICSV